MLTDEWVSKQCAEDPFPPAAESSVEGQLLVRRHMGNESGEERINRLVFIGRTLDSKRLTEGFEQCFFTAGSRDPATDADPFGRYIEISPYTLEQIRYWMRQNFNFPKEVPIVIKEVPCVKDRCPPIETSIMAMVKNAPPRAFKVQKPINEITFDHIYDLIENPMPCC